MTERRPATPLPPVTAAPVGPPPVVPPPVALTPTTRTARQDVDLVQELFGTWTQYVYGRAEDADAVAYIRPLALGSGSNQWRVFCLFSRRAGSTHGTLYAVASAAYLTLADTPDPTMPGDVAWYYSGYIHDTARTLDGVKDLDYTDTPGVPIPESIHLPRRRPNIIRPAKG